MARLIVIAREEQSSVIPLILSAHKIDEQYYMDNDLKRLIKDLSKPSPVCNSVPYDDHLHEIIRMIIHEQSLNTEQQSTLLIKCPIISDILSKYGNIPKEIKPILHELLRLSRKPFMRIVHDLPASKDECVGAYFPHLPTRVERGTYTQDRKTKTKYISNCVKKSAKSQRFVPGIFHLSCQHGETAYLLEGIFHVKK